MNFSVFTLLLVFVLIAARRIGRLRVRMWQVMLAGATMVLVGGQISPKAALRAVDLDVMLFLFGMFVVGQAMVTSGYLYTLADRIFGSLRSTDGLVLAMLFSAGMASAVLMNDTLAVIATPLMLTLAREHRLDPRLLLFTLVFAVTLGSAMSPIGNPQNLLIAVRGPVVDPFVTFFKALGVPTLVNLLLTYLWLRVVFRREFHGAPLKHRPASLNDPNLAALARWALLIVFVLIALKSVLIVLTVGLDFPLSDIALAAAAPILLFSSARWRLLRSVDWGTLIFFLAMFVLMAAVWQSGFLQAQLAHWQGQMDSSAYSLAAGVILSQFISNVPMVALYLPLLAHGGTHTASLMALAAGSTVAGNLLIMGAASNVIIIHNAERHGISLTFLEFARVGVPLTMLNVVVYWTYLYWLYGL